MTDSASDISAENEKIISNFLSLWCNYKIDEPSECAADKAAAQKTAFYISLQRRFFGELIVFDIRSPVYPLQKADIRIVYADNIEAIFELDYF